MNRAQHFIGLDDDPLWYQKAIIYQVHVRAFADSNADGVGDFRGLCDRLDYIHDLGVTAIWVLPFYPSPLRDAGYDIADYRAVNPEYGTLADVRRFVREAHARGIRVITELVLNHTSDQHPWFQRARRSPPGSRWRDFYVWSDDPHRYKGTRIIFTDYEHSNWTWDEVAGAYYWHRFYHHQPDLNWDNPAVKNAMFKVLDFWFDMGIDGLRLDAVPYLIEREGTTCENLEETHDILKELRAHVDESYSGRMLLAEANQWPEDACAYFGDGDECHMNFHFPLMPRLFMAIQSEERYPIIDILEQTPRIPGNCQWAVFLRNHDELTLEMVTDEERDYMYRKYAADPQARINLGIRRRLAPLLSNDRRKIELANGLLFSLAGTPIVYYGDEIGMGDNIYLGDRDGVRTPMQWSADRNAGFSHANPQRLYLPVNIDPEYRYEAINVETQHGNGSSLYWWMKRAIALRHRFPVFGTGELEFLFPDNPKVLAYLRRDEKMVVLVVANLARSVQYVELDLSELEGRAPRELFGGTRFPPIGELPYLLTLGPHAIYWFDVSEEQEVAEEDGALPVVQTDAPFESLLAGRVKSLVEAALARALPRRRWFAGKARTITGAELREVIPTQTEGAPAVVAIIRVNYTSGDPEDYTVPLAWAEGGEAARVIHEQPHAPFVAVESPGRQAVLYDAMYDSAFTRWLLQLVGSRSRRARGIHGQIGGVRSRRYRSLVPSGPLPDGVLLRAEQSNTSVVFGDAIILKLFRRLELGVNPDYEIGLRLTEGARFERFAAVAGAIEYQPDQGSVQTIAVLQQYLHNEGDAWQHTLGHVERVLISVIESPDSTAAAAALASDATAMALAEAPATELSAEILGAYLDSVELLGRRTGEMHVALAAETSDPAFVPEEFTGHYLRGLFQAMRNQTTTSFGLLRKRRRYLEEDLQEAITDLLERRADVLARMKRITRARLTGLRIRCHGDYHLGQVLYTGKDFAIIDFEGEPTRSIGARRLKQSPLRDVAGMLRSFDYAAQASVLHLVKTGSLQEDSEVLDAARTAAAAWSLHARGAFLRGYFGTPDIEPLLPAAVEERSELLDAFVLEKSVYELAYELSHRPDWVSIPIAGILDLLEDES